MVIFGASDDLCEVRGAFSDEAGCYDGGEMHLTRKGFIEAHDCECEFCGYPNAIKLAAKIEAIWDEGGMSWQYKTDIPHATFDILEDEGIYCRGLVIDINDLPESGK